MYSEDEMINTALELDGNWAMTHGSFVHVKPLYDPGSFSSQADEVDSAEEA